MSAENAALGDIRLFDNFIPALEADDYVLKVGQTVSSDDPAHSLDETATATQTLSVAAPRFALPPRDVHSCYPPANARGAFDQNFAHVVLAERVLPWERLIKASDPATRGTPWMALLLFADGELIEPADTAAPAALTNPTLSASYPVSAPAGTDSLMEPADPAVLGPALTVEKTDETTCRAIEVGTATFASLAPVLAELPFLAHVRDAGAALAHKATEEAAGEGWFSVVIGNRLPSAVGSGRWIAHLVSLEGFTDYLVGAPAWPAGKTRVRLASLASWSFTCLPEAGNFAALARNLVAGPIGALTVTSGGSGYTDAPAVTLSGGGGTGASAVAVVEGGAVTRLVLVTAGTGYATPPTVGFRGGGGAGAAAVAIPLAVGGEPLRLRLPATPPSPPPTDQRAAAAAAAATAALAQGYAPLAYEMRIGDRSFGWYHGPLVPEPVEPIADPAWTSSSAATIYDPGTGTFDLSYAVAWETGRLAALAARAQGSAKIALGKTLRREVNRARGAARLGLVSAKDDAARHALIDWMGRSLADRLPAPNRPARARQRTPFATGTPSGRSAAADLAALAAGGSLTAPLARHLAAALAEPQFAVVTEFLAGLRLLEGIPFAALVPHPAMLPPEAIRFFYVDPNYLDALTDGATSLGLQTGRDRAHARLLRAPLRAAARASAAMRRARRTGGRAPGGLAGDPVAGFLLRSALVSGWPGLEVRAYGATIAGSDPLRADPATLIAPLRFERLAPDVLLCLYPEVPAWIEVDEPNEGVAFGVEDPTEEGGPPVVALRFLDDSAGDMGLVTGTEVALSAEYLRSPDTRVVDVAGWQAHLATQVPVSTTAWGPAAYAIEMVRAPEQFVFQTRSDTPAAAAAPMEAARHG